MGLVVNVSEVRKTFDALGWTGLGTAEVGEWLKDSGIDPAEFLSYCKALLASPDGLNPASVSGIKPGDVPYIYEFLHGKGVVY